MGGNGYKKNDSKKSKKRPREEEVPEYDEYYEIPDEDDGTGQGKEISNLKTIFESLDSESEMQSSIYLMLDN